MSDMPLDQQFPNRDQQYYPLPKGLWDALYLPQKIASSLTRFGINELREFAILAPIAAEAAICGEVGHEAVRLITDLQETLEAAMVLRPFGSELCLSSHHTDTNATYELRMRDRSSELIWTAMLPSDWTEAFQSQDILPYIRESAVLNGDSSWECHAPLDLFTTTFAPPTLDWPLLAEIMETLKPQEREVLSVRFGLNNQPKKTLEAIGTEMHVTRARVSQIAAKGLKRLRDRSREKRMDEFVRPLFFLAKTLALGWDAPLFASAVGMLPEGRVHDPRGLIRLCREVGEHEWPKPFSDFERLVAQAEMEGSSTLPVESEPLSPSSSTLASVMSLDSVKQALADWPAFSPYGRLRLRLVEQEEKLLANSRQLPPDTLRGVLEGKGLIPFSEIATRVNAVLPEKIHLTAAIGPASEVLDDWERDLNRRLDTIDLLGEFGLSSDDRTDIGSCLHLLLETSGIESANRALGSRWSVTLAAYLVAEGAANYEAGNYWDSVCKATGLPRQSTSSWGDLFLQTLKRIGKPNFDSMVSDQRAVRFVARILAHGGIPSYCLDDFFRDVLGGRARADWWVTDAGELVDEWRRQRDPLPFADKPVKRFLIYGGSVAVDFLDRCLDMAYRAREGMTLNSTELGLPEPVVERYRAFLSLLSPTESVRGVSERTMARYVRPWLRFDPWGGGVELILPEQTVPPEVTAARLTWTVTIANEVKSTRVAVHPRGRLRVASSTGLWLSRSAPSFVVTLLDGGLVLHRWEIPGLDGRRPLLLFTPANGRCIETIGGLPADLCWAILPQGQTVIVGYQGSDRESPLSEPEELPAPSGWTAHRAALVDLRACDRLIFRVPGANDELLLPVRSLLEEPPRPRLQGGQPAETDNDVLEGTLYAGRLPNVFIPSASEATGRWTVHVRPISPAHPAAPQVLQLDDLPYETVVGGQLLSLSAVLGEGPIGSFVIRLRGPLGQDATLRLRTMPMLTIEGGEQPVLPGETGAVDVLIDASARLLPEGDDVTIGAPQPSSNGRLHYQVVPPPEGREIALRYRRTFPDGRTAEVPLRIPVRRLRWSLVGVAPDSSSLAESRTVVAEFADLIEAEDPRLVLDLPFTTDGTAVQSALVDGDGELQVGEWTAVSSSSRPGLIRLDAFRDSLRNSGRSEQRMELRVRRGGAAAQTVTLLQVRQLPAVISLQVSVVGSGPQIVECSWQEVRPTPDRSLLIWSLRRPWDPPLVLDGLKEAVESWRGPLDPPLPPGRYRAALQSIDPWVGSAMGALPGAGAANVADFGVLADGSVGPAHDDVLERFFSGRPTSHHEVPLVELLEPLISGEIRRNYGLDAEREARRLCGQRPAELMAAISALAGGFTPTHERAVADLLIVIGAGGWTPDLLDGGDIDSERSGDLWLIWPPLGLFADLWSAIDGNNEAEIRVRHHLGPSAINPLDDEEDERAPTRHGGVPAELLGLIEQAEQSKGPGGRAIVRWKRDLASGLLGLEALVEARYESLSLISGNEVREQALREQVASRLRPLDQLLQQITRRIALPRYLLDMLLSARDQGAVLRNVPFVVGMAALLQRYQARRPDSLSQLIQQSVIDRLGREAAQAAPLLYQRDLCFVELTLCLDG